MSYTSLAEIEEFLDEIGLDRGALALIVAEALDEDLGGRGVLPGAGGGCRCHFGRHHSGRRCRSRRIRRPAGRVFWPECRSPPSWWRSCAVPRVKWRSISIAPTVRRSFAVMC